MFFVRQGATHKLLIGPVVAVGDGFTPVTTLSLGSADEAEGILHDNGTVVSIAAYTLAAITGADGYYHLTLQSGITNTVGHVTIAINDDSLCLPVRADYTVVEEAVYDAYYAASAPGYVANAPVNVAQFGGSNGTFSSGRPEVNATHFAGQTITAAAGVTLPSSVASPTNITAGTITTATNLTNLPTIPANWLTAAGTAADFTTEIQSGLATASSLSTVGTNVSTAVTQTTAANIRAAVGLAAADLDDQLVVLDDISGTVIKLDDTLDDGGSGWIFSAAALAEAPSGSGSSDWTADQRTAIAAILGIPGSGTTPADPTTGILDTIRDSVATRASQTSVDDLPTTAELATALGTADDAVLAAIGVVDTVVDAIKLVTDNIPQLGVEYDWTTDNGTVGTTIEEP